MMYYIQSCELHELFKEFRELGITKCEEFKTEVETLLDLFQQQWKLLQDTRITLGDLADKCEDCEWAIDGWKKEVTKAIGQKNHEPNMKRIATCMTTLNSWLENQEAVEKLYNDWSDFKTKVEKFVPKWDRISEAVKKEVN